MTDISRRKFLGGGLVAGTAATVALTTASGWNLTVIKKKANPEAVSLRYALWDPNQQPAQQQIIDDFRKKNPNVHITIENTAFADYWPKLQTEGTAKNMPDVLWMNFTNFLDYANAGLFTDLSPMIKKDKVNMGDYPKQLVNAYTLNGKHYGLPKDFDTIGLWYNKKLFASAGVKTPDETWNWTTIHQAAQKLTNKSTGVWGIGADLADQEGFFNTIYQNDGYVWNGKNSGIGKPAAVAGLSFWTDFIKEGSSPNVGDLTENDQNHDLFMSGKLAMCYAGDWNTIAFAQSSVKSDIDVTVLPIGKKRAVNIHGLGLMIAQNSQHKHQAWEFIKYAAGKEAAITQASTGAVLPAYNGLASKWVAKYPQYNAKIYTDELAYAFPIPIRTKDSQAWANAEVPDLTPAWELKESPAAAAKKFQADIDKDAGGKGGA